MSKIKLTTNKALQSVHALSRVDSIACVLAKAEQFGAITVHSHGQLIQNAIDEIESALTLMKQFQNIVQGR